MQFVKYHALGNDYLVYADDAKFALNTEQIRRVCDRHHGLGSDGILVLEARTSTQFKLRIVNPDGSDAEKSGNGLRIFSRYLRDRSWVQDEWFDILTPGGLVGARVAQDMRSVEVRMGRADFAAQAVPVSVPAAEAIDWPLALNGMNLRINAVSMGNPHCVVFLDDVSSEQARLLGPQIERHALFPRRTNVQFVKVLDRHNLRIEIWERGAGYTLSSGTSSCAAAAVSRLHGFCEADVVVHTAGGRLRVRIGDDWQVVMQGAVQRIGCLSVDDECFAPLDDGRG
ncbi:diaminopimelate epimerase [Burkholderia sp. MSh2]|uniref:Diaminopimelate epimerase n=1 Tax=Burkholderia paludis TaxID=1506587 RepID=A0A6J5F6Y8_9BURK|nr:MULTISPECIES: diaminopimelate epimerase [Burkholderia]KEZ03706.1 diaminopimelate epimerase [Burkholderia sp. MSh2]CAB3772916.1 Diaminopimelate epimerase [Burkholderia paludis]VWC44071.1 diaminopimelate epimerase [Burkholderia paludis]